MVLHIPNTDKFQYCLIAIKACWSLCPQSSPREGYHRNVIILRIIWSIFAIQTSQVAKFYLYLGPSYIDIILPTEKTLIRHYPIPDRRTTNYRKPRSDPSTIVLHPNLRENDLQSKRLSGLATSWVAAIQSLYESKNGPISASSPNDDQISYLLNSTRGRSTSHREAVLSHPSVLLLNHSQILSLFQIWVIRSLP